MLGFILVCLLLTVGSCSKEKVIVQGTNPPPCDPNNPSPNPNPNPGMSELAREVNAARQARGLSTVLTSSALDCAALRHARDISRMNVCGHVGSDGSQFWQRAQACGAQGASGEIVACGYPSSRTAVTGWTNSPGHAAIMYDPGQKFMGTAVVNNFYVVVWAK
jgi:uncharacterized protein YkwD